MGVDLGVLIPQSTEDLVPYEEPDPNEPAKAHYINPPANTHIWQPGMETAEIVEIARITEQEVIALCGYKWIPKYNPEGLPVCERCAEIAGDMILGEG